MRAIALTDFKRGAPRAVVLALGCVVALALAALASGLGARTEAQGAPGQEARVSQGAARLPGEAEDLEQPGEEPSAEAQGARVAVASDGPALQLQRPWSSGRGRSGSPSSPQSLQRAVRDRQAAIITAMGQRMRCSAAPVAEGYGADRPTIVTRPLRGPPVGV